MDLLHAANLRHNVKFTVNKFAFLTTNMAIMFNATIRLDEMLEKYHCLLTQELLSLLPHLAAFRQPSGL